VANYFGDSNQEAEPYVMSGGAPMLHPHKGELVSRLPEIYQMTITNIPFEATMDFHKYDMRRDKTGQLMSKVGEMGSKAGDHWNKLLTDLIETGESALAYDGVAFFGNHTIGSRLDAPTFLNLLTTTEIAALDVVDEDNPSQSELAQIIAKMIDHMYTAKDEFGDPVNGTVKKWIVMVPANMGSALVGAVRNNRLEIGQDNILMAQNYSIEPIINQRLTQTNAIYVLRQSADFAPFILQSEMELSFEVLGPGSDHYVKHDKVLFTAKASRNVGFGEFLYAAKATLDTIEGGG
jgi:phage major head subunit gpT-like protein